MESANPFAQAPATPEPIIAQVRRQLERDGLAMPGGTLDGVVDRAVRELWQSRVKTFVPVLALRQAREMLRELSLAQPLPPESLASAHVAATTTFTDGRDALALGGDILHLDEADALRY
jgi:hypothetical protein